MSADTGILTASELIDGIQAGLQTHHDQFQQILDLLPAAVYTTDAAGRITYYNRAAAELAGREPEIGKDEWCVTFRLFTADGKPLAHDQCPMAIALREGRPVRGVEAIAERPDGTKFPFLPFPSPLYDERGRLSGAVNMLVDISERKQAEANQRTLLVELNHRVKNNMQMLYSLLLAAERDASSEEARSIIADAAQRVAAMSAAQRLLYSDGNARSVRAEELLCAVCAGARQTVGDGVEIVIEADDCRLANDTALPLALILNELLTNSVKYAFKNCKTGTIKATLKYCGRDIVLSVEDDGPGFEPRDTGRLSSGLGLVRGLAGQLGGTFTVSQGPGARCQLSFPEIRTH